MSSATANSFRFTRPQGPVDVTALSAVMSDFSYGRHCHEEYALGVTLSGVQEFSCKGSEFRSLPGNVILFNPGDEHDGRPGGPAPLEYAMVYIGAHDLRPLMGCACGGMAAECRIPETNFEDRALRRLILDLSRLVEGGGGSALEREHHVYRIARRLTQRQGRFHPVGHTQRKDSALLRVRDYIHDNLAEDLTVDDLGRVANMSKYHLIRLFRSQFGVSPHRYIVNHRVNGARDGLRDGLSATDAALRFGFYDASHLNRHFKRAFGLTPMQYRAQMARRD